MPKLSVVIVSYNTKDLLRKCLLSLDNLGINDYEVIVVDNNSQDGSVEMIKLGYPQVRLIENQSNLGFAQAANQGLSVARGRYTFFLNSDAQVTCPVRESTDFSNGVGPICPTCPEPDPPAGGDWFRVLSYLNSQPKVGAVGLKIVDQQGDTQPFTWGDHQTLYGIILSKFFPKQLKLPKHPINVEWVSAGAMLARTDLIKHLGGFDERFFFYFEDMDLCWRVKEAGHKVVYYPGVSVKHIGGASFKSSNKKKWDLYFASQEKFFKKHYGWGQVLLLRVLRRPFRFLFR